MKTYRGVEVQLLIFLPWLKLEVIVHLRNLDILLPLKKESEYLLYRPCGPTTPSKHHGYAAQERVVCKEKLGDLNIILSGNYVKCDWKCCVHCFFWKTTFIMCLKNTEYLYLCSGRVAVFLLLLTHWCLKSGILVT